MVDTTKGDIITSQTRIYLHEPVSPEWCNWDVAGRVLRDLAFETVCALNYVITEWHVFERNSIAQYRETGASPSKEERREFRNNQYAECRGIMKTAAASIVSTTARVAEQKYRNSKSDVIHLRQSVPSFKMGHPIVIRTGEKEIKLTHEDGNYFFECPLQNKNQPLTRIKFRLDTFRFEPSKKAIIDRIISGEYKLGICQIARDKKEKHGKRRWFVRLAYSFPRPRITRDKSICVGVDLGLTHPFYCAVNNSHKRLFSNEAQLVERFRYQIRRRRRAFQNALKFSNRGGHGKKKSLEPLKKLAENERNYRDTKYHLYTSQIIVFAVKCNAGIIQIEKLEGFRASQEGILKDWAIADFQEKLRYKAERAGIEISEVDARYTSQRCHKCGHIDMENRPSRSEFECTACGHKDNADYNAAKNLSIIGIEDLIKRTLGGASNSLQAELDLGPTGPEINPEISFLHGTGSL